MVDFSFSRSSKGEPISVIKDIVSKLTYSEMQTLAKAIKADPQVLSDWAEGRELLSAPMTNTISTATQAQG